MLGDEPGPSGSIDGHGLRLSGRSGDPGGRGDADDYYYEVKCANPFLTLFYSSGLTRTQPNSAYYQCIFVS